MKLHDVVELREVLKTVYARDRVEHELDQLIDGIESVKDKYSEDYSWRFTQLINEIHAIKAKLKDPEIHVEDMKSMVSDDLNDATEKFRLPTYQSELQYKNPDAI